MVLCLVDSNINAASIFTADLCRVKCSLSLPVKLHGITAQKSVKCIYTTVTASNPTFFFRSLVGDRMVRGSNLGGRGGGWSEIFRTPPAQWPSPVSYTKDAVSLPWVKRSKRDADYTPPITTDVKEREEIYLYSPPGPTWSVLGWHLHLLIAIVAITACILVAGYAPDIRLFALRRMLSSKTLK
jgi:hypothetical protein